MTGDGPDGLFDELRGEQLSAVTFVQDYLQLWFDGPGIDVTNPLEVTCGDQRLVSGQPGFRDLLCGQIAKVVRLVEYLAGDALKITFEDGSRLSISLRSEDCDSPEAFFAHGFKNGAWSAESFGAATPSELANEPLQPTSSDGSVGDLEQS
jgi:hypothetical protein